MIERIGNLAERLATNVSQSRRGFLARVGQAALGAAGVLGALLALPGAAQAIGPRQGYCGVVFSGGTPVYNGYCYWPRPTGCPIFFSSDCPAGHKAGGVNSDRLCGLVGKKCRF
jgi:hypothetical protein